MKNFRCSVCDQILYFESTQCVNCSSALCYLPDVGTLSVVRDVTASAEDSRPRVEAVGDAKRLDTYYVRCRNQLEHAACNWAFPASSPDGTVREFCDACRLNELVPDLTDADNLSRWRQMEAAKRRLLYTLSQLGLSYCSKSEDSERGMSFRFLADGPSSRDKVLTGHSDGIITINIAEADSAWREHTRQSLGEAYRTLLGHFRHEIGHLYWDILIQGTNRIEPFRELFGDERADYAEALKAHYASDPKPPRKPGFVSDYAMMHPWEDWAETWAHYLHMVDTLETAHAYGIAITNVGAHVALTELDWSRFDDLLSNWLPVTLALNSLNRSVGQPDPYPFTLDDGCNTKLRFVHEVIQASRGMSPPSRSRRSMQPAIADQANLQL